MAALLPVWVSFIDAIMLTILTFCLLAQYNYA
jgi:hypothetical protein